MRADDTYRAELHATIRNLGAFADGLTDVARVDVTETGDHWRLRLLPREPAACPVELILHSDQSYDIMIGSEVYEGRPVETLAGMLPLVTAIVDGHVITRTWSTLATGAHHSIATRVEVPDGDGWYGERRNAIIARIADHDSCAVRDRHFAPYRSAATVTSLRAA